MFKKAERAKKQSKNKASVTSGTAEKPFADMSGLLEITLRMDNGNVTLVNCSFTENTLKGLAHRAPKKTEPEELNADSGNQMLDCIFIRENKILQRLQLADILYIQAMGDYVSIYTKDRKITIHQNLKALENKLPVSKFIRVHRSYMVALDKIEAIEESTVYISTNPIPVGEAYKSKMMKLLSIIR